MIHPATELRLVDPEMGFGVFATAPIPRGTIVWALDPLDRVLTRAEVLALPAAMGFDADRHLWLDRQGRFVLAWDLARFVNHSCQPNCAATACGCEIAVADIAAGDQLTNDYADLGMAPGESLACRCGAPDCRGLVQPAQAGLIRAALAEAVVLALRCADGVAQPLRPLLAETALAALGLAWPGPAACGPLAAAR